MRQFGRRCGLWAAMLAAGMAGGAVAQPVAPLPLPERSAYVAMLRADQQRDEGAQAEALDSYREALALFEKLASEQPDYKREIIQRRIAYCRDQIARLQTLSPPAPQIGRTSQPSAPEKERLERLALLEKALEELQRSHRELAEASARFQAERDLAWRARDLAEERRRAAAEMASELRERLAAAEAKWREAEAVRQRAAEKQERLKADLDTLQRRAEAAGTLEQALETARADLVGLADQLQAAREALAAEQAAAEELRARLQAAKEEAKMLKEEVAVLRAKSAEVENFALARARLEAALEAARARSAEDRRALDAARAAFEVERTRLAQEIERLHHDLRVALGPSSEWVRVAPSTLPAVEMAPEPLAPVPAPNVEPPNDVIDEPNAAVWLQRGEEALKAGDYPAAAVAAENVLRLEPNRLEGRLLLARTALARGDLREARRLAERLARDFRHKAAPEHLLGLVAEHEKNLNLAVRHFRRAAALNANDVLVHRDLAAAYCALGRYDEAIEVFRTIVSLDPQDGRAHFNLAALLSVREKDLPLAREHYGRAVELGEPRDEALEARLHP